MPELAELYELGEPLQELHVNPVGVARKYFSTAVGDFEEAPAHSAEESCLHQVGASPADPVSDHPILAAREHLLPFVLGELELVGQRLDDAEKTVLAVVS